MLFCVQRRHNSKKKILKSINFCVCQVAILNIAAILAAILKNRVDESDTHIERMQLEKILKFINFNFWQVAILNIMAILAAILKNKVSHDASRMEHILSAKNGIKIRYRLARLRAHTRTHARTHTRTHARTQDEKVVSP